MVEPQHDMPGLRPARGGFRTALAAVVGFLVLAVACAPRPATTAPGLPASASRSVRTFATSALDARGRLFIRPVGSVANHLPFVVVDLEQGVPLGEFSGHMAHASDGLALALAPSAALVASLRGRRDEILVWEPWTQKLLTRIRTEASQDVVGFGFTPDSGSLLVATAGGLERRTLPEGRRTAAWAIPGVRAFVAMPGPTGELLLAVEHPKGPFFVFVGERGKTRRLRIPGVTGVEDLRVSPDGRWLAVSAWGRGTADTLQVWDLHTRRRLAMDVADRSVNAVEFSPDSRVLAASLGLPCDHPAKPQLLAWDLTHDEVIAAIPLDSLTALRVIGQEILADLGNSVVRVDLHSGHLTPILTSPCAFPCGVRLCG